MIIFYILKMKHKTAYYAAAAVIVVLAVCYRRYSWRNVRSGVYSRLISPGKNIHLVSGYLAGITNPFNFKNETGETLYLVNRFRVNAGPSSKLTVRATGNAYIVAGRTPDGLVASGIDLSGPTGGSVEIGANGNAKQSVYCEYLIKLENNREISITAVPGQGQSVIIE